MPKQILTINKKELYDISLLLTKGYPLPTVLDILGNYEMIQKELEQGRRFEDFLDLKKHNSFNQALCFFMDITALDVAIQSAYEYDELKRKTKSNWIKEISYPLFVLFFALAVFFLFEIKIYPQLSIFGDDTSFQLHKILSFFIFTLFICFIIFIFIIMILIFLKYNQTNYFEKFYRNVFSKIKLVKKYVTYDYALFSAILIKQGFSTKQVFESLLTLKSNQLLSYDLNDMIEEFEKGIEMIEIILNQVNFDEVFKKYFKIGYYSGNLENTMQDYCSHQQKEFLFLVKKATIFISASSYLFIMLLVVSIYQLLLTPLNMIQQF